MIISEASQTEKERFREFMLGRLRDGADPRSLMIGYAATLGTAVATLSVNEAHLEQNLTTLNQVMRNSAQMESLEPGHA